MLVGWSLQRVTEVVAEVDYCELKLIVLNPQEQTDTGTSSPEIQLKWSLLRYEKHRTGGSWVVGEYFSDNFSVTMASTSGEGDYPQPGIPQLKSIAQGGH